MSSSNCFVLAMATLIAFTTAEFASAQVSDWTNVANVDLGSDGYDFDFDLTRNLAYVSVPSRNEIAYVSLSGGEITARHFVGSQPFGVDYGRHSDRVYVALNQAAAVAQVNPDTQAVDEIVVGFADNGTNSSLIHDVVEAADGQVFASANAGGVSTSFIARVDTDNDNAVTRVASDRGIRFAPTFLTTPDEKTLFIGEGANPNSLFNLDITNDQAPIVFEDDRSLRGTQFTAISPDGERIYLASGQVVRSDNLLQIGQIGPGQSRLSSDGEIAYVFEDGSLVGYDTNTFSITDKVIELPSEFSDGIDQFAFLPNNGGLVALSGQDLFIATSITAVPEPSCGMLAVVGLLFGVARRRKQ